MISAHQLPTFRSQMTQRKGLRLPSNGLLGRGSRVRVPPASPETNQLRARPASRPGFSRADLANSAHLLPTSSAKTPAAAQCSPATPAAQPKPPSDPPRCPDCGTPLKQIDPRPGKERWICPVALEAKRRGLLGQPGRKHKECWVWTRVPLV